MPDLLTAAGAPVDLAAVKASADADFAQAMAGTPDDQAADIPAPPARMVRDAGTDDRPRRRGRPPGSKNLPKDDKPRTAAPPRAGLNSDQRREGARGLVQVGAAVCLMWGKATGSVALAADAVTLASSADDLAAAAVATADQDARFAAALDRVCAAGPWAALISAGIGVGTQMVRNHRPSLELPGTVHPADLLKTAEPVPAAA